MIEVDIKKVDDLFDENLKTTAHTIRLKKITKDRLDWLVYDHLKKGDRHSYSQLVNKAVDLYYDFYVKEISNESRPHKRDRNRTSTSAEE